jgi:hypothetical protein
MKKIVLSEQQVKKVIDTILNEQQASEFKGGTDAQKITHALLTKNFGLPDGGNHENYYYGANVADVIKVSESGNKSQYLSVFKPFNKYNEDPKGYMDSIYVNNESLRDSGSKSFRFVSGQVFGTHNGLLSLTRAMDQMSGRGGVLTISFGSSTKGKEAESERMSSGVKFDSNRALNQTPTINSLENMLVFLSVHPDLKNQGTFVGVKRDMSNDELVEFIKKILGYTIIGAYGFMDWSKKDEIIKNLTPKGFITNLDFDVTSYTQKLISLQNTPDKLANDGQYKGYNEAKRKQLDSIGSSFEENMINQVKSIYMKNFQIYVENYLPNSSSQIIPLIKNVNFKYNGLGETHYINFHSYVGGASQSTTTLKQQNANYKTGN